MPESAVLLVTVVLHMKMARFNLSKRPINSVKNIVDSVALGVGAGTNTIVTVANAVNDYTGTAGDCPTGSVGVVLGGIGIITSLRPGRP